MTRLLVCCTFVVVLVGAAFAGCANLHRGPMPSALVGRWRGGIHTNGPWYYEFGTDGGYRTWPVRGPGTVNFGTVFVLGSQITFSNGGAPITVTWSLSHGQLVLDGQPYTRA